MKYSAVGVDSRVSLRACEKIVGQSPDTPWPVLGSDHGVFGDCVSLRGCEKISRWAVAHVLWVPRSVRGRPARNGLRKTSGRDARDPRRIWHLWCQSRRHWAVAHVLWVPRSVRGRPARNGLRKTSGRDARDPRTIWHLWLQSRWR